jgi:hypothetical protein
MDRLGRAKRAAKAVLRLKPALVSTAVSKQRTVAATPVNVPKEIPSDRVTSNPRGKGNSKVFYKGGIIMPGKKHSSARELIDTGNDKRFVRRDDKGQFKESDDVGKSLAADRRQHAKTKAKKGQGDRGDH